MDHSDSYGPPESLKYMNIVNGREGKAIISGTPSLSTGNLIPYFEIVNGYNGDGSVLDDSFMSYVTISNPETSAWKLDNKDEYPVNENGDTIKGGTNINLLDAGVITIADGNNFTVGDYYFSVKVTTKGNGQTFSTVFDKVFHIKVEPLLPPYLIYQLKTQNLIYGDPNSKTSVPLIPVGNKDVRFSLESDEGKISIDPSTGAVSLHSNYIYNGYDTIRPSIKVTSNISEESISFPGSLVVIVTNVPEIMPIESILLFYPTLATTGAFPSGGDGFSVQVVTLGLSSRIWGPQANSTGGTFVAPPERPSTNGAQKAIEACANSSASSTTPTTFWCIMTTQDLSLYNVGYDLFMTYYYMPVFQSYLSDGRTPTDLEIYVSTDYTGGAIQNSNGSWANGTWTKINEEITCNIGGVNGAPWGEAFVGTPYPGNQAGEDPDGRKDPARSPYQKWVKCSYDITKYKNSSTFTVAFKVASYFTGTLLNNATAPGRGGRYFLTDFNIIATEVNP